MQRSFWLTLPDKRMEKITLSYEETQPTVEDVRVLLDASEWTKTDEGLVRSSAVDTIKPA